MRTQHFTVQGERVEIHTVEHEEDLEGFKNFIRANLACLAVDSETTDLEIYSESFGLRLIQFGNDREAWVIPVEKGEVYQEVVRRALKGVRKLVVHNAPFDLAVFDRHLWVRMETLWGKVVDTQSIAKLVDPRPPEHGGIGSSLEDLTEHYISADIAEGVKGMMTRLAKEHKTTKSRIFRLIDLFHPEYQLYAGMDTILAFRLWKQQPTPKRKLMEWERKVSEICTLMSRRGFLLDVEYSEGLSAKLLEDQERWSEVAAKFGVDNVNSASQVAEGLIDLGVTLTEKTKTGQLSVSKDVLDPLIAAGNPLAEAVHEAKKAGKWRKTWVDTFLSTRDENDRCHPSINTLQARTGRMSITGIPAQTLPSGDWMIRRCFVAEPGHRIVSVDYMAQELRVLASLSGDKRMIQAFREGADLHLMTARAAFGEHIQKGDKERDYAKVVNFGRVYGGGARTVAKQTGLDLKTAQLVVSGFDTAYPGVKTYSNQLSTRARRWGFIETPVGRRLPVDKDRPYSALNYMVQSTSRDVTCRGLVKLHEADMTDYLRLPIHDEALASCPAEDAEDMAHEIAELMAEDMGPVWIGTEAEVGLRSWGSLYVKNEQDKHLLGTVVI